MYGNSLDGVPYGYLLPIFRSMQLGFDRNRDIFSDTFVYNYLTIKEFLFFPNATKNSNH